MVTTSWSVSAAIITFDDLPKDKLTTIVDGATVSLLPSIPDGYAGLSWGNFSYSQLSRYENIDTGYSQAATSGTLFAFNTEAKVASVAGGTYDLISAQLTAAWNDGLLVTVIGYADGAIKYQNTYLLNTSSPTLITFNYSGVDQVEFSSSGGVHNPVFLGHGTHFAMDDMVIEPHYTIPVPEPATFIAGAGMLGLFCWSQRKTSAKG